MRIRIRVRLRLAAADGCCRRGSDAEDPGKKRLSVSTYCLHTSGIRSWQVGGAGCHFPVAISEGSAEGAGAALHTSSSTSPKRAGRRTSKRSESAIAGLNQQRKQNGWQNVADVWYYADAQQAPTIGSLKQRLLQSVARGELGLSLEAATALSVLARSWLSSYQQRHLYFSAVRCGDVCEQCLRIPSLTGTAPSVVLRLQGAILPDDQPLHLLEKDDHVEMCISHIVSSRGPLQASGAATEGCAGMAHSPLPFLPVPAASGAVHRLQTAVGLEGSPRCGRCTIHCASRRKAEEQEEEDLSARLATESGPAASVTQQPKKRFRVQEMKIGKSRASHTPVQRKSHDVTEQSRAAASAAGCVASPPRRRVIYVSVNTKKRNRTSGLSRVKAIKRAATTTTRPAPGKRSRQSNVSSSISTAGKGHQGKRSRIVSNRTNTAKKEVNPARRRRGSHVGLAARGCGTKARQSFPAPQRGSRTRKAASCDAGEPHVRDKKRRKSAAVRAASTAEKVRDGTTAGGGAASSAEATAPDGVPPLSASARAVRSEKVLQRPSTAAAGRQQGVTDAQKRASEESSSEEESSREEKTSSEAESSTSGSEGESGSDDESASDAKDNGRRKLQAQRKTRGQVPASKAAMTAETAAPPAQAKQPALQVIAATSHAWGAGGNDSRNERGNTTDNSSSSSSSSTCSSSSSSSEEDTAPAKGGLTGTKRLRGRMPAAVARAAAAWAGRPAATIRGQQEDSKSDFTRSGNLQGQQEDTKPDYTRFGRIHEGTAVGGVAPVRQPQFERATRDVGGYNSSSGMRTAPRSSSAYAGRRVPSGETGKVAGSREEGVGRLNGTSSSREPPQQLREQEQQQRQKQCERQQPQLQQLHDKSRHSHPLQKGREQHGGDMFELLAFKPWDTPVLAAIQRGEWLRVRLLHLANGMPTLDAWKTVQVEATDLPAGRIKLWELRQRCPTDTNRRSIKDYSSTPGGTNISNHLRADSEASEKGGCTVRVPCRKLGGNQKGGGGGAGRWYDWHEVACISRATTEGDTANTEAAGTAAVGASTVEAANTAEAAGNTAEAANTANAASTAEAANTAVAADTAQAANTAEAALLSNTNAESARASPKAGPAAAAPSAMAAAAATPSRQEADKADTMEECSAGDISKHMAAVQVPLMNSPRGPQTKDGLFASRDFFQRSPAPLRYLPRRLLALRQHSLSKEEAAAEGGEKEAAATQPPRTHNSSHGETTANATGPPLVDTQHSSALANSKIALSDNSSATPLSSESAAKVSLEGVVQNGTKSHDANSMLYSFSSQINTEENTAGGNNSSGSTSVPTAAASKSKPATPLGVSGEVAGSGLSAGTSKRAGSSTAGGETTGISPIDGILPAAGIESRQLSTNTGKFGGKHANESAAADREKEQWKALVTHGLVIHLGKDGEALMASHPAIPTAPFHLPLPRELAQEFCRRWRTLLHNRLNSKCTEEVENTVDGQVSSPTACSKETRANPSKQSSHTEALNAEQHGLCSEEDRPRQQDDGDSSARGSGCYIERLIATGPDSTRGEVEVVTATGSGSDRETGNDGHVGVVTSTGGGSDADVRRAVATTETWKGFDCVRACARRVVGEQLQQIRRAVRRQVDYYFSPENWQKDVYLRSRRVPLSSTGALSHTSNGSEKGGDDISGSVNDSAEKVTSVAESGSSGRAGEVHNNARGAKKETFTEKEAVKGAKLGIDLDDVMAFPRMQGLSKDRNFVAWCISAGGGLQHVELERHGNKHWLIRKVVVADAQGRTDSNARTQRRFAAQPSS